MDPEQIERKIEWLDSERRKDKAALSALEERLQALEKSIESLRKEVRDTGKAVSAATTTAARIEQFETRLAQQRSEILAALEEAEKRAQRREREAAKRHQAGVDEVNRAVAELRAALDGLEVKKNFKARADEDARLAGLIGELKTRVEEAMRVNEEVLREHRAAEELRKADARRMADLQGEVSAIRKRADEHREKIELNADGLRHLETRIGELLAAEAERKAAQTAFLEQQSLAQVERDRAFKEARERLEAFRRQSETLDTQLQALDATHRAMRQAQERHEELNQKMERRINEITEVQRLAEDRLRQEWVTFKADDQKRWTGYTLAQEEALREVRDDLAKIEERMTALDDLAQQLHDQLEQTTDSTEQQMQALMNWAQEWLDAYRRIMGHARKTR